MLCVQEAIVCASHLGGKTLWLFRAVILFGASSNCWKALSAPARPFEVHGGGEISLGMIVSVFSFVAKICG